MSLKRFIPVAEPALVGNEKQYVLDCLDSNWISSNGKYIEKFKSAFAEFCSVRHALSCSIGIAALHIALLWKRLIGISSAGQKWLYTTKQIFLVLLKSVSRPRQRMDAVFTG